MRPPIARRAEDSGYFVMLGQPHVLAGAVRRFRASLDSTFALH